MEKIASSAIQLSTGVVCHVPAPWGHSDVMSALVQHVHTCYPEEARRGPLVGENCIQGFLTDKGRFVERVEALAIAQAADQIVKKHPNYDILYSEDIWLDDRIDLYGQKLAIEQAEGKKYEGSYFQFWREQDAKKNE